MITLTKTPAAVLEAIFLCGCIGGSQQGSLVPWMGLFLICWCKKMIHSAPKTQGPRENRQLNWELTVVIDYAMEGKSTGQWEHTLSPQEQDAGRLSEE